MLALEDVVDLEAGPVPIEPLVVAVREADVDAGVLSDEEIVLMSPDPDREPEPQFDAPRLARLSAEERDVAVASAVWVLRAHDLIRPREDGEMVSVGLAAIVGDIRWGSEATVRVRTDVRGQGIARAAVYRARPELFLTEEVFDEGMHQFTFRGTARQAAWLAAFVDPGGRARQTQPAQTAARPEDLNVTSDQLAATSDVSALAAWTPAGDHHPRRSFTAYSNTDGLQVLHGWQLPTLGEVHLQHLGPRDLAAFCAAFLTASARSS